MGVHDDSEDVDKVLAGDLSAFERIVFRWQGPLINLAYRFCRDHSRAQDMAQEAFLKAYRGLRGWRRDAAFSTWLFSIATNCYRTHLRRIPAATLPLDTLLQIADGRRALGLSDPERNQAVRLAVSALPAKYRDALILFYFHDMDIAGAARSLNLPEGTVKARLSRGREILRRKLPQYLGELKLKEVR